MKINDYFQIEEFVPPSIFSKYGQNSLWFIDPKIINLATAYRKYFDAPITINNWHNSGTFSLRGYRPPDSDVGAQLSQHKFGRAFDCNVVGMTPQDMYKAIIANQVYFMSFGLTTLENIEFTKTWLHSDVRQTNQPTLLIVNP